MRPILWIDAQILKFFTKIAKDFNWITGKDNFFLAKILLVISGIISIFKHDWMGLVVLLSVFFPLWILINLSKPNSEKEQIEQTKVLSYHCVDQNFRLSSSVLMILVVGLEKYLSYFTSGVIAMFLVAYLISIDKPPFQKSQAWQKIKSLFSSAVAVPQAEPVPVRSN